MSDKFDENIAFGFVMLMIILFLCWVYISCEKRNKCESKCKKLGLYGETRIRGSKTQCICHKPFVVK